MPVLVTVDGSSVAHRLVARLLQEGGEVRAYVSRGAEAPLRAAGAFVATGDVDDEGRLEAAMAQVHTVVHVAGDPLAPSAGHVATAGDTATRAAVNAGVRRLVVVSLIGAGAAGAGPLRGALGRVETALQAAPVPTVVLRTGLVDTPELRDALASSPPSGALAGVEVAPVRDSDLIDLVVAIDALRSEAHEGHVAFRADGPRRTTLGAHVEALGLGGARVGRTWRPASEHPLLQPALRGPWSDEDATLFDAWSFVGLSPQPPRPAR
jgi:uncharacterized protein YbjT (DUF2867 family)